ncbi:hypothetical protein DAMA08_035710 [Martiniozyma asiatica (nom. inval.)]|nr:hypothetical protein DAMA08_035710 [Martiniozyma asiatica]
MPTPTLLSPSFKDQFQKFNQFYLKSLKNSPFKTKATTLVALSILNEQLATLFAGDLNRFNFSLPITKDKKIELSIPHGFSSKVPMLALFSVLINTPFNHYGYNFILKAIPPTNTKRKILQIILSCITLTPAFAICFISWISMINNAEWFLMLNLIKNRKFKELKERVQILFSKIIIAIKTSFLKVCRNSWITTPIFTAIAQKFIPDDLWALFFSICYFLLNTFNNTKVKLAQKEDDLKKAKEDIIKESLVEKDSIN